MNNICKASLLAVLISAGNVAAAEDGTITFTGKISDATCEITGGDATSGESTTPDFTVTLPSVSVTALDTDGMRAGDTPFHITLSGANCTDGKVASVYFELAQSTYLDTTTGNLKNSTAKESGGADKVQVGLLDSDKSILNLTTANNSAKTATISGNTARFDYWAQYVATGGASTAGVVNSEVVYSIKYQ
ncbi:type 1 fimbrial protein [Citrobacter sp. EC_71]|uniref:fimbrial protein n=1 Tax=unclassified Citrobacter TaxID=2644389 RepID=UPI0010C9DA07|nr:MULTISPECIES: fimbrial protein [unclassified Citrobacter]MBW9352997.1 type 1 fimbrial protein [Citrobacter sp. EC_71]TKU01736.1 type 1 fimbrial protein [Citrobacter sp. wls830]TKV14234.1 type 1 fimbrial protein [Citrobacter sp. wls615]